MRKLRRYILLSAIVAGLGGVAYKSAELMGRAQEEIRANPLSALDYLPESALQLKDFHRSKIENGRKVWELFGEEANYYKEQKEAVIKNPRFYYYDKDGEMAETQGSEARIYLNENQLERMELLGDIQVTFQGYVLNSERANYFPAKDQIVLPGHTTVRGEGIAVEGARMEVELEDKKIRLIQSVKTRIDPDKLQKRKSSGDSSPRLGG